MRTRQIGFALLLALLANATPTLAGVPSVINYQGRLTQPSGAPVADGTYSMLFSIYAAPTGGTALWSETNPSVAVKGGLFATLLGSVTGIPANTFDSPTRYFAVKVDSDPEMTPRQQVASSAFAFRAAVAGTVDDGAITAAKLATGVAIPPGGVIMWSGAAANIPGGWALCNGQNGTPDLRNRFVVGAGDEYAVAATGGEKLHQLTVTEMPSHNHGVTDPGHSHTLDHEALSAAGSGVWSPAFANSAQGYTTRTATTGISIQNSGGSGGVTQAHENRPPYYALCYIMKLAY